MLYKMLILKRESTLLNVHRYVLYWYLYQSHKIIVASYQQSYREGHTQIVIMYIQSIQLLKCTFLIDENEAMWTVVKNACYLGQGRIQDFDQKGAN